MCALCTFTLKWSQQLKNNINQFPYCRYDIREEIVMLDWSQLGLKRERKKKKNLYFSKFKNQLK